MYKSPVFWLEVVDAISYVTGLDWLGNIATVIAIIVMVFTSNNKQLVDVDEYVMAD